MMVAERFALDDLVAADGFERIIAEERVETIHTEEATLEDVFLEVTGTTLV